MLRGSQTIAVVAALAAYVILLWIWQLNGFTIGFENIFPSDRSLVLNFFNVLATIIIAWFTVVLARVGRRQVQDTRVLQRAYVSAEAHGIRPMSDMPDLVAHVRIANAGNLPARAVRWRIKTLFDDSGARQTFEVEDSELYGNNVITPKSEMIQGSGRIASAKMLLNQDIIRRSRGKKHAYLYVYGLVGYEDGFGNIQHTRFCHRYNCATFDQRNNTIAADRARQHQFGNDAN